MEVEAYKQQKMRDGEMEGMNMPDMGDIDIPKPGKARSGSRMPSGSSSGVVNQAGSTEATQHPALAGYDTLINVSGDDEDE